MSAKGVEIADAFVRDCQAATWSQPCDFERRYLAIENVDNLDRVLVQIAYAGQRMQASSRASWIHLYDIDVAVMRKLQSDDNHEADRYSTLLDEIVDDWKYNAPTGTGAVMTAAEWLRPYVPEHLQNQRTFTGVVRMTFRLART